MVDLPDARAALSTLEPSLIRVHQTAIAKWSTLCSEHPDLGTPCDSTTRANFIHDHVEFEITREVEHHSGVVIADGLGFTALRIDPSILLRFKYVGQGAPSNVSTTQQRLLAKQTFSDEMMFALDGDSALTPPTMLTCGYTLDDGALGRIEIRRDCKGHLPWHYDIYGGVATIQPLVLDGLADTTKPARITKPGKKQAGGAEATA